jgi:hypothetical protein
MIDHSCAECGDANAPFGYGPPGTRFTDAPERYQWFCRRHRPDRDEEDEVAKDDAVVEEVEEFEVPF